MKRLCSDFKKNERGEEDIRKVFLWWPSLSWYYTAVELHFSLKVLHAQIMATAELHLSMLEKELLSRIDLDGSRKNGKRGEKQSSNERSPLKKAEKREVGTRNETQTPTRQRQTSVNKQSRAWEEQAFNAQVRALHLRFEDICIVGRAVNCTQSWLFFFPDVRVHSWSFVGN